MHPPPARLYYVHDPMCSWCWGFRPVWQAMQRRLAGRLEIRYLLGGLAADTDSPMPESMQDTIQETWRRIQREIPGTRFNFDFWRDCRPRRSTYPACRALIACRILAPSREADMLLAIQQAYYLEARNPSDMSVLVELAESLGLEAGRFAQTVGGDDCHRRLQAEIEHSRELYVYSFPSLVLDHAGGADILKIDYTDCRPMLRQIDRLLAGDR